MNWPLALQGRKRVRPVIFTKKADMLELPLTVTNSHQEAFEIYTAIDPSVFYFKGENWVAFECQAFVPGTTRNIHPSTSVCLAPFTTGINAKIDANRIQIIVAGRNYHASGNIMSASVPNLFLHQGKPYLYWTVVDEDFADGRTDDWNQITTRGAELIWSEEDRHFYVKNHYREVLPTNHPDSVVILDETYRPSNNASWKAKTVADVFDVRSDGRHVYMTAGVSRECLLPSDEVGVYVPDCYRISIAKSDNPLVYRGFNGQALNLLPDQSMNYTTFIDAPKVASQSQGDLHLLGMAFYADYRANDRTTVVRGLHLMKQ